MDSHIRRNAGHNKDDNKTKYTCMYQVFIVYTTLYTRI